jgi:ribosome-binding protein aMBF1 (putative translation factor)
MSAIELSEKEVTTLVSALESYLPDLATERVGTDNKEWHAELKEQEATLGDILKRLKSVKS